MAWQQQNPLANYDKSRVWVNTDAYIDMGVRAVIETDKIILDPNKNVNDALLMKVLAVDQLENIMAGLGKVRKGFDADGKPFQYQGQCDSARAVLETEKIEPMPNVSLKMLKDVKWATVRFQILLSALQNSKPMNIELTG